jgi:hypothetical protein
MEGNTYLTANTWGRGKREEYETIMLTDDRFFALL